MALFGGLVATLVVTVAAAPPRDALGDEHQFPRQVVTGRFFSLFVDTFHGKVLASGRNDYGQLGIDTGGLDLDTPTLIEFPVTKVPSKFVIQSNTATNITNDTANDTTNDTANDTANDTMNWTGPEPEHWKVVDAVAGAFHSIFLTDKGSVWVTGRNHFGQLADPENRTQISIPIEIFESGVRAVAAGYAHSLFLTDTGLLQGVGLNVHGQLGLGDVEKRTTLSPINVCNQCNIISVAAGYDTSFALTQEGHVWAFGNNFGGQLGIGRLDIATSAVRVDLENVRAVGAGTSHTLFWQKNPETSDQIYAAGANFAGQLGDGRQNRSEYVPIRVRSSSELTSVSAGGDSSCLVEGGELLGFGSNLDGQLGLGSSDEVYVPTPISVETLVKVQFQFATIGAHHGLFLDQKGDVYVSGSNRYGQLGDNTTSDRNKLSGPIVLNLDPLPTTTRVTTEPATSMTTNMTTSPGPTSTRNPNEEDSFDWTTAYWGIGTVVTFLGLLVGVVAQGQAARRAAEDDDNTEVELVGS